MAVGLSYYLLEGLVSLQAQNRLAQAEGDAEDTVVAKIVDEDFCAFEYKPYKNIYFDSISPEISTEIEVDTDNLLADLEVVSDVYIEPEPKVKAVIKSQKALIAIVIDDMGIANQRTKDILSIKAPLTTSFLTYSKNLPQYFALAKVSNQEIIAHIPMEAKIQSNVAPDCLLVDMNKKKIQKKLNKMLDKFPNIKGINNHTGSLFTENEEDMSAVLEVLQSRNLYFLDSKTSNHSVGRKVAEKEGVAYLNRHVFLDNENNFDYILKQLKLTEKIAQKKGFAIAIGHPKSQTYLALKHWLEVSKNPNIQLVHLSDLLKK